MADEGTPLLAVREVAIERARAGRARAACMAIFVTIGFFHFLLDGGLAYAKPGSGGSQSGDTVVSPPCCHSGSLAGRRATEASPACIPCPGSSSGAGSSIATAFSVYPACSDGTRVKLAISGGKLGPYPPQWPIPTVSGLFYTSAFLPCTPQRHGKLRVKGTDDCWWRSQKAGSDPKKHAALYECDRTTNTHGILEGETAAEARQRSQRASGETAKEARLRTDQAAGFATSSEARKAREVAYAKTHGHWRDPLRTMVSKDGVPFLQMEHLSKIKWQYDFTGSDGTVSPQDMALRNRVVDQLYELMKPTNPPDSPNGHALRSLLSHQAVCGHYMVADTEFHRLQSGSIGEVGVEVGVDDDDDAEHHRSTTSAYARIYDISLPIADCRGNILERWVRTSPNHGVAFSTTEGGRSILSEAIERLRAYQPEALRISWGHPELALFEMAGVCPMDRSNGIDVRQALLSVMPWCKPSGIIPFSTSQNLLVPFLGLRAGPLHNAEQDTFDEAVTITALLDGLTRIYNPGSSAAPSAAAASAVASSSTARPGGLIQTILVTDASSSTARTEGPEVKKARTGTKATTRDVDAASSLKLTSFFAPKPKRE